jgi:uncharacterized membrane protein YdbT with pleckstrin-like domain
VPLQAPERWSQRSGAPSGNDYFQRCSIPVYTSNIKALGPSVAVNHFQDATPQLGGIIMAATTETTAWNGTPSQIINFWTFFFSGLFFWLVFPLFIMLWKWLVVKNIKYELTNERLRTRHGVLNKKTDELELYRVRDYKLEQPFFLRLFSLGNIVLLTSDKTHSVVTIQAIPGGEELREKIRTFVEECRVKKRVREVDFE